MKHPDADIEALLQALVHPKLAVIDMSLDRVRGLMRALGDPQDHLPPVIHVAGTNGKGSLLAYLSAIFQTAGLRVHRYISPHLVQFNERIMLAGKDIDNTTLKPLLERMLHLTKHHPVTFFEATTAAAFCAFAEHPADVVLLETGLGGRLDATNLVRRPAITAITPVSFDHKEFLGHTLAAIAAEKAGILKEGVPCIIGPQAPDSMEAIAARAKMLHAPVLRHGKEWHVAREAGGLRYRSRNQDMLYALPGLAGEHQIINAGMALAVLEQWQGALPGKDAIDKGLMSAVWPARLQRLGAGALIRLLPEGQSLWLDGGHNPAAGEMLAEWLRSRNAKAHLVVGMLKNKDRKAFLAPLAPFAASLTALAIPGETDSCDPCSLKDAGMALGIPSTTADNVKDALKNIAITDNNHEVLICGSLYLAGHILWLNSQKQ